MKRQLTTILVLLFCKMVLGQDNIKLSRGKKTVILKQNKEAYFYQSIKKGNGDSIYVYYDADLIKATSDSIIIKPRETYQYITFSDKRKWETHTFYNTDTVSRISLNINDIDKILVSRPLANGLLFTGLLAAVSAVAVSPLVSINYNQGTFNKDKYATVAGVSTAVFVPCMIIGTKCNYRHYYLKSGKKRWTIVH